MKHSEKLSSPSPKEINNIHKLLPFVFIAEAGLAVLQIGFCISLSTWLYIVGALASVAAIVFTVLYALNIKPRFNVVAVIICIALVFFSFFLTVAIGEFSSAASYKNTLATIEDEYTKSVYTDAITRYNLLGSIYLIFAASIVPLSVYLPIWYLKCHAPNA